MFSCSNGLTIHLLRSYLPEKAWWIMVQSHAQHLVEVTVVEFALPIDTQSGSAHEPFDCGRIKMVSQQLEVSFPLPLLPQVLGKATNRLIGERVKVMENDSVLAE